MERLTYAVVTPARNERENLERLAGSVLAQTRPPAAWVIVDDGSVDGMDAVSEQLAAEVDWILARGTGRDTAAVHRGRREGRDLEAFKIGIRALPRPVDVFVKVDADTSFDPGYFDLLLERFAADPQLGIAGGACYELENGEWQRYKVAATHPRGASRAYRWALREDVLALEPSLGWDGVDEVLAELRGYRTQGFTDLGFRHHRPVGHREGRLRAGAALGRQAWHMGYRPSYVLLRALYRARQNAASVAMIWGYVAAAAAGSPRCSHPTVVDHVRDRQRLRQVLRGGAPT